MGTKTKSAVASAKVRRPKRIQDMDTLASNLMAINCPDELSVAAVTACVMDHLAYGRREIEPAGPCPEELTDQQFHAGIEKFGDVWLADVIASLDDHSDEQI